MEIFILTLNFSFQQTVRFVTWKAFNKKKAPRRYLNALINPDCVVVNDKYYGSSAAF